MALFRIYTFIALCLCTTQYVFGRNGKDSDLVKSYNSDREYSVIGQRENMVFDSTIDNTHILDIPNLPEHFQAHLIYRIKGAKNSTALAKSMNGELAIGGFLAEPGNEWTEVSERINPLALKEGKNQLTFSLPDRAGYYCEIQDLRIVIREEDSNMTEAIVIDESSLVTDDKNYYFSGYARKDVKQLNVNGEEIPLRNGQFEFYGFSKDKEFSIQVINEDNALKTYRLKRRNFKNVSQPTGLGPSIPSKKFFGSNVKFYGLTASGQIPIGSESNECEVFVLRSIDTAPLQPDVTNVTSSVYGYRLKADNKDFQALTVGIQYDQHKIPSGYSSADVGIYSYNKNLERWVKIKVDSMNQSLSTVYFQKGQYDDFIAGVIKVPESPETASYISTSIKDLEIGDVSEGISMISPPKANNMGSANMSFNFKVPAGRGGMQPSLSLNYNSQAGNGKCGLGWSLPVSQIVVDTRWGVPRYNQDFNSETYLMDGQMLDNVSHRPGFTQVGRVSDQEYHPRVEGEFKTIVRYGTSPSEHYWVVTHKSGVKYYYGGVNEVDENSVLTDGNGNIAKWMLAKVENPNGQSMIYTCSVELIDNSDSPRHQGKQIYLEEISYTHHETADGKYLVEFEYDNDREDVSINCKKGFKEVTEQRLSDIVIRYNGEEVRSYKIEYETGAFFKSLVKNIIEYDADGEEFYRHELGYFDTGNGDLFENNFEQFDTEANEIQGELTITGALDIDDFTDQASSLGGTNSKNRSIGGSLVAGLGSNVTNKNLTLGGNFHRSDAESEGLAAMIDITGDNLPDKIEVRDGIFYRKNISTTPNEVIFADAIPIPSFPGSSFSKSKTKGKSGGFEATGGIGPLGASYGKGKNSSETVTSVYLIDRNGDGLTDVVKDGLVYFNTLDENGNPVFSETSNANTENPLEANADMSGAIFEVDPNEYTAEFLEEQPLHDIIKVWTAPLDGTIDINGEVILSHLEIPDTNYTGMLDGVFVSIQHNDELIWEEELLPSINTDSADPGTIQRDINKDDRIYFRVNSRFDGYLDEVLWSPTIQYTTTQNPTLDLTEDVNGVSLIEYNSESDFLLMNDQTVYLSQPGTLTINTDFHKLSSVSEDVRVAIQVYDTLGVLVDTWYERQLAYDSIYGPDVQTLVEPISEGMVGFELEFIIDTKTNVNWDAFEWNPTISFDEENFFQPVVKNNMYNRIHQWSQNAAFQAYPPVIHSISQAQAGDSITYRVRPYFYNFLGLIPNLLVTDLGDTSFTSDITLAIKGVDGTFYGSRTFTYDEQFDPQGHLDEILEVRIPNNSDLFIELYIDSSILADSLSRKYPDNTLPNWSGLRIEEQSEYIDELGEIETTDFDPVDQEFAVYTKPREEEIIFGHNYKGWGQIVYRGNEFRDDGFPEKIDEEKLVIPDYEDLAGNAGGIGDPDELDGIEGLEGLDPTTAPIALMCLDAETKGWMAYDSLTYVSANALSSSRLGEDDPVFPSLINDGVDIFEAPLKRSRSSGNHKSFGYSAGVIGASYSESSSNGISYIDAIDFNGDRYPDYLNDSIIQYTNILGGLETNVMVHDQGLHETSSTAMGSAVSGSAVTSKDGSPAPSASVGGVTFFTGNGGYGSSDEIKGSKSSHSISVNTNTNSGNSTVNSTWMDINGDGLPDRVLQVDSVTVSVSLNIGYSFLEPQVWNFSNIRLGANEDFSAGIGVSLFSGSIQAGVGGSWSENFAVKGFLDINSDGLQDMVFAEVDGNRITAVRYNLGDSFSPMVSINNPNLGRMDQAYSAGESANAAFTVGVSFLFFKICVNPGASLGRGFSRQETQLMDINNDGFQDYISTKSNNDLKVLFSKIGKTNKLRSITGPLGAEYTLDYQPTATSYKYPNPKWVMNSLEIFDGHEGDGEDISKYAFVYREGKYDRREREDYGFAQVETHELDKEEEIYRRYVSTYDNEGYYTNGLLLSEVMLDADDKKWTETNNTYELRDQNGEAIENSETFNDENDFGIAWPTLISTSDIFYEGEIGSSIERLIEFEYDEIGNVVTFTDFGDDSQADDLVAEISYHDLGEIRNIPDSITVLNNEKVMRTRGQSVDGSGNVTQIRQHYEAGAVVFDFEYYNNSSPLQGSIKKMTRPRNVNDERVFYEYEYDEEVFQYITKVSDVYGYTSRSEYDYSFGMPLKSTDLNGHDISYGLDAKGRVVSVTGPYEQGTGDKTISISYEPNADPPYSIVSHFDPEVEGNRIETITFLDGLSRPIQVQKDGVIYDGSAETNQFIASGKVEYDEFGRAISSAYPVGTGSTTLGQYSTITSPYKTSTEYDVLDREISRTLPDGAISCTNYSIDDSENFVKTFKTETVDFEGNSTQVFTDVKGRNLKNVRFLDAGATPIPVTFKYNAINELLKVTDVANNETKYSYDRLGRKLTYDHPDGGLIEFEYDGVGNLLSKVTPNIRTTFEGEAIEYSYDHERLVKIVYPENFQNYVKFTYGSAADTLYNRAGRVYLQEDASGAQEHFFGPLGETIKTVRTVVVNNQNYQTYISEAEYDTWNRIQTMTYPDGEVVDYAYNEAGKLNALTSSKGNHNYNIINALSYDEFEDRVRLVHGNGVETKYTYEPERRRLSTLQTRLPTGRVVMDNSYEYDSMNNITELANLVGIPSGEQLGGQAQNSYEYDDLYRLQWASGNYNGAGRSDEYTLNMTYDLQHNILTKNQEHFINGTVAPGTSYISEYTYEDERPHVPTSVGELSQQYDANGNLIVSNNGLQEPTLNKYTQFEWDEENRLESVSENGVISQYTYDAQGERVIKSHGNIQGAFINGGLTGFTNHRDNYTLYISPYLVVQDAQFTKHYFVEGQRVLSKIGTGEFQRGGTLGVPIYTAGGINFERKLDSLQQAYNDYLYDVGATPWHPTLNNQNLEPSVTGIPVDLNTDNIFSDPPQNWPNPYNDPNDATGTGGLGVEIPLVPSDSLTAGYLFTETSNDSETNRYFYHSDHLGSTGYITNAGGGISQHMEYLPFGEALVDEHNTNDTLHYLFNGKERDELTGLYYYGTRYYNPKTSIWLSVDPMAEKYQGWSPYNYTLQNPVIYIDPDGQAVHLGIIAGVGALVGATVGVITTEGNWKDKTVAGAKGGISGAGAAFVGGVAVTAGVSAFGVAVFSGVTGAGLDQAMEAISGGEVSSSDFGVDAALSLIPIPGSEKLKKFAGKAIDGKSLNQYKREFGDQLKYKMSWKKWKAEKNRRAKEMFNSAQESLR
ncbi:MAG: SpvB/TcaC N-terminal domain-containing protein, partial [Bacteroidota bacterium]